MIISDTADVCPNCASTNVRWRRRRHYDVIFTYLRYLIDTIAGAVFGAGRTNTIGSSGSERATAAYLRALEYTQERQVYESRAGTMTASCFWKCPDCGQKGQVFDHVERVLEEREHLVGMEGAIHRDLGSVSSPIGSNERKTD